MAILKDAVDKPTGEDSPYLPDDDLPCDGASCWICLEEGPDEHGMRIRRGCACRGDSAGWAHPLCLAKYCCTKFENTEDCVEQDDAWSKCRTCVTRYQGRVGLALSSVFVSMLPDSPELTYASFRARTSLAKFLLGGDGIIRDPDIVDCHLVEMDVVRARDLLEEILLGFEAGWNGVPPGEKIMYRAGTVHQLAVANQALGDLETALMLHRRVLRITNELWKRPDTSAVAAASLIGASNRHIESISGEKAPKVDGNAIVRLEGAISGILLRHGKESEFACDVQCLLCDMLYSADRNDEAIKMMSCIIQTAVRSLGPCHPRTEKFRRRLIIYQEDELIRST